jgi:hypothetical protein
MDTRYQAQYEEALDASYLDLQSWLQAILSPLTDYFEASASSIFINMGTHIACLASMGYTASLAGIARYKAGEGLTGSVFQNQLPQNLSNYQQNRQGQGKYDFFKTNQNVANTIMIAPLIFNKQILGVIKVEDKRQSLPFDRKDYQDFQQKAKDIAQAIYTKALILPQIPFKRADGSFLVYPHCLFVLADYPNDIYHYIGGVKSIEIMVNGVARDLINVLSQMKPQDYVDFLNSNEAKIYYNINFLGESMNNVGQNDVRAMQQLLQPNTLVHYRNEPNTPYPLKGSVIRVDSETFTVLVKNLETNKEIRVSFLDIRTFFNNEFK